MIQAKDSALYTFLQIPAPGPPGTPKSQPPGLLPSHERPPLDPKPYLQSCGQAPPPTMEMGWLDHFPRAKTAE